MFFLWLSQLRSRLAAVRNNNIEIQIVILLLLLLFILSIMNQYKTPLSSYVAGVSDMFPRSNRLRMVESGIEDRCEVDVLPFNAGINGSVTDNYAEFRWPAGQNCYIDLSRLVLEIKGNLKKGDGTSLGEADHAVLCNSAMHSLIKSVSVYFNGQQVEQNPLYNFSSYVRLETGMSPSLKKTLGRNMYYYDSSSIPRTYNKEIFTNASTQEKSAMSEVKTHGFHFMAPLLLDIASMDMYLLDNVSMRIRLEFASDKFVINAEPEASSSNPKVEIETCKLHLTTLKPRDSAREALNKSLLRSPLSYIFNKTLYKTYVMASNQTQLSIDMPWGSTIPEKLALFMVDMKAYAGNYSENPLHFGHNHLSKLSVIVNNNSVYNISTSFPSRCSDLYYHSLNALGLEKEHSLDRDGFVNGKMVAVLDLQPEKLQDAIAIENSGSLRIAVELSQPHDSNIVLFLVGDTQGVMYVDSDRRVVTDIRA